MFFFQNDSILIMCINACYVNSWHDNLFLGHCEISFINLDRDWNTKWKLISRNKAWFTHYFKTLV